MVASCHVPLMVCLCKYLSNNPRSDLVSNGLGGRSLHIRPCLIFAEKEPETAWHRYVVPRGQKRRRIITSSVAAWKTSQNTGLVGLHVSYSAPESVARVRVQLHRFPMFFGGHLPRHLSLLFICCKWLVLYHFLSFLVTEHIHTATQKKNLLDFLLFYSRRYIQGSSRIR